MSSSDQMETETSETEEIQTTDASEQTTDEDRESVLGNIDINDFSVSSRTLIGSPEPSEVAVTHTQSMPATDGTTSVSTCPIQTDSSTSAKAKSKTRPRRSSIVASHDRVPRSASRQRPRSEEDPGPSKRAKHEKNGSQTKQPKKKDSVTKAPDKAIMIYLDNLIDVKVY